MSLNKKILSIDSDDDNDNYEAFSEYLDNDTERKKVNTANQIEELGEQFIDEIERKRQNQKQISRTLIPYILKKSGNKYTEEELLAYSFDDVKKIYEEVKEENKSFITKFFHFLFNL